MVFITDHEYCSKLLEEFWQQVEAASEILDTLIHLDGETFFAHSYILSTACPCFYQTLENLSKNSYVNNDQALKNIKINGNISNMNLKGTKLSAVQFGKILKFLYTGQIHIPEENFKETLAFAEEFQFKNLLDICKIYEEKQGELTETTESDIPMDEEDEVTVMIDPLPREIPEMNEAPTEEIDEINGVKDDKFRCLSCQKLFPNSKALSKHYATSHKGPNYDGVMLPCMGCGRAFMNTDDLIQHKCSDNASNSLLNCILSEEKVSTSRGEADAQHTCIYCLKSFVDLSLMLEHEEKHKCDKCNKAFDTIDGCSSHKCSAFNDRMVYECTLCGKNYTNRQCFISHQKAHLGVRGLSCPFCKKTFLHRLPLQKHLLTHTNHESAYKYICRVCNSKFRLKIKLYNHYIRANHLTEEVPYRCKHCPMLCSSDNNLRCHERTHSQTKPFPCKDCDKRYSSKQGLQFHINSVHLNKLLFKCAECGRKFAQRAHLADHKRVHTKEKKHVCSFCGLAVSSKMNLTRHESMHTGLREFSCIVCEKKFAVSHDLKRHMQGQHSDYQFVCENCGTPFNSLPKLKRHMKKAHPDEDYKEGS